MSSSSFPNVSALIQRARQGDAAGRDQLFALCRSYLQIIARAQVETSLRAKVDASDLVQETLLEAFRDFQRFGGNSEQEWLAWLKRILAHNAADFIRRYRGTAKRQARREVPIRGPRDSTLAPGVSEPAAPCQTPSQEFLRIDDELRVTAALAELPPDYQEVIVLRNLQRLPFNEVAERMERSRPAVQMLWMRAIKKLQESLGEKDSDEGRVANQSRLPSN
jgi:RNA polymerase sigma-70 factor (ECF subfamily)